MHIFHDRAGFAHALTLDLDPYLRRLLVERIAQLSDDLIDETEIVVIEPTDDEEQVVNNLGWSPLVEPMDSLRAGANGFTPYWDWFVEHDGGWYEMIVTYGSTFAMLMLLKSNEPELRAMCAQYARPFKKT
jgi:hypothetical protein